MKPELWGPLGLLIGAIFTGLLGFASEKVRKRASPTDLAKATGEIWEQINKRLDDERTALSAQVTECRTALTVANEIGKKRDIATWDHLEARDDYDEATDRVVETLERIARRVMTDQELVDYEADASVRRAHRATLDEADRALRQALFR